MNNNTWIKRSDRQPTHDEYPVVFGGYNEGVWIDSITMKDYPLNYMPSYTHWRSIKYDPPPRELTQHEMDKATVDSIVVSYRYSGLQRQISEAIYAERREVAKLLAVWFCRSDWGTDPSSPDELKRLCARLDEQGGGM